MNCSDFSLRNRRRELGLTLENVGKYVGVSKGTVSKWENGNIKNMRSDKIALLSEILQVSIMDILRICQPDTDINYNSDISSTESVDDESFIHPEDLSYQKRYKFSDSLNDDKCFIMYQDLSGVPVYEEFSKEDFDFIVRTIKMLKRKSDSK